MKQKPLILAVLTAFTVIVSSVVLSTVKVLAFSGSGSGTSTSPYIITTCSELNQISSNESAYYALGNNINCSGVSLTVSGSNFTGNFNGDYNTISNMTLSDGSNDNIGLFGLVDNATISNLTLSNATVNGLSYVGALAGFLNNSTVTNVAVINSSVTGGETVGGMIGDIETTNFSDNYVSNTTISGSYGGGGTANDIGGMFGDVDGGAAVSDSFVAGGTITGNTNGGGYAAYDGGFVGHDDSGDSYNNTYSTATVNGGAPVGGYAGAMLSNVTNSYAFGSVTGTSEVGGMFGVFYEGTGSYDFAAGSVSGGGAAGFVSVTSSGSPATVTNDYWDETRTGQSGCITTNQLIGVTCTGVNIASAQPNYFFNNTTNAPLNNWNFSNTWLLQSNGFPVLSFALPALLDVDATSSTDEIALNWNLPSGAPVITDYFLEYRAVGSSTWSTVSPSSSATSYTLTGLSTGTAYQFQLDYSTAFGTSSFQSLTATTTDPVNAPGTGYGAPRNNVMILAILSGSALVSGISLLLLYKRSTL